MSDDELRADLREIREAASALSAKISEVANAIHGHLNQIEAQLEAKTAEFKALVAKQGTPAPWWQRPAIAALWAVVAIFTIGAAGWLAQMTLLPPGYLERFLDALLSAVEQVE